MYIDGDALIISTDLDSSEVEELKNFVITRLDFIEEILFEEESLESFVTSSLFQLLFSIKKSKPEIKIPFLSKEGAVFTDFGSIEWKTHE